LTDQANNDSTAANYGAVGRAVLCAPPAAARTEAGVQRSARPTKPLSSHDVQEVPPAHAGRGSAPDRLAPRDRFLKACHCQPVDRPPLWLMRQAGRALPEYRALKAKYSFLELVKTPELAAEVTLQPIWRFGFDAAILFSDILVVAEALGQPFILLEGGGVQMQFPLRSPGDVERLETAAVAERLQYMAEALRLVKTALGGRTALIGFAGSPWTLANFMLEGGSAASFTAAKALRQSDPRSFDRLAEKLTSAIAACLRLQLEAGADAVQLFDTLGGLLPEDQFAPASARWMQQIVAELGGRAPVIVFARGVNNCWETLVDTGANVLGVDEAARLAEVRARLPRNVGVQGNLAPALLTAMPAQVAAAARGLLEEMRGAAGFIFNLGHGVPPDAKLENIEALVSTVQAFA
jgi:uroporphyrinogen decarboxylase